MRSRLLPELIAVAAGMALAGPLAAQSNAEGGAAWRIEGLRRAFCVQLLLAPSTAALGSLPAGLHPLPASRAGDLHVSLRSVIEGQPEFAAWSPSRLCLEAIDSLDGGSFTLTNHKGRKPHLFALWTVSAADSAGTPREVALGIFASSSRMVRSARLAGQEVHDARISVGRVPGEDENGVPYADRRFQVKLDKTTITWDGRPAGDSAAVQGAVELVWLAPGSRGPVSTGRISLDPAFSRAMVGSLKIEGRNDFANALKASPTRFAGPEYLGGSGTVRFGP